MVICFHLSLCWLCEEGPGSPDPISPSSTSGLNWNSNGDPDLSPSIAAGAHAALVAEGEYIPAAQTEFFSLLLAISGTEDRSPAHLLLNLLFKQGSQSENWLKGKVRGQKKLASGSG